MPHSVTRDGLYKRVWETPIDTLRKEFGLSNVGLGKLCDRWNIPVPPRGYWAKKRAGHRMPPPPALPPSADPDAGNVIHFHGHPPTKTGQAQHHS